jgi:hypothetical protein
VDGLLGENIIERRWGRNKGRIPGILPDIPMDVVESGNGTSKREPPLSSFR